MGVSDLLKAHMDAVRSVTTTSDKLSISDATSILKEPQLADAYSIDPGTFWENQARKEQVKDSAWRFTSAVSNAYNVGFYIPSDAIKNTGATTGDYMFECMIRGTVSLNRIGEEGQNQIIVDRLFNESRWKVLRFPFAWSGGVFDFYGNRFPMGEWFEISQPRFIKMS